MSFGGVYAVVAFASLGGVLFGLDQGNWGGAIVKDQFVDDFCEGSHQECHNADSLPDSYMSFLAVGSSLVQLGAAFGALSIAPWCSRQHGRRQTLFLGSMIALCGNLGQAITANKATFLMLRFADGVGVGLVTYALPMYVSEVAPVAIRGALGCMMPLTTVVGIVTASLLNCAPWFSYQISFSLPCYPAVILALGIFCLPISPRYALMKWQRRGDIQKGINLAKASLMRLRSSSDNVEAELSELREAVEGETEQAPWSALWKDRSIFRRMLVASMLQWLQQLSGVNAILSYGPAIFNSAGLPLDGLICILIVNAINLVVTIVSTFVIDRWGRRFLLLLGAACMFITMTSAAVLAFILEQLEADHARRPALGWMLLLCVCGYMAAFAVGWSSVPWVYPSEIFPMAVKEKALSTSVCSQWIANFLIAFIVPVKVKALKVSGTFSFYALCLGCSFLLVHKFVPETKGKTEEEINQLFGSPDLSDAKQSLASAREIRGTDCLPFVQSLNGCPTSSP